MSVRRSKPKVIRFAIQFSVMSELLVLSIASVIVAKGSDFMALDESRAANVASGSVSEPSSLLYFLTVNFIREKDCGLRTSALPSYPWKLSFLRIYLKYASNV